MQQRGSTTGHSAEWKERSTDVINAHVPPGSIATLTHYSTKGTIFPSWNKEGLAAQLSLSKQLHCSCSYRTNQTGTTAGLWEIHRKLKPLHLFIFGSSMSIYIYICSYTAVLCLSNCCTTVHMGCVQYTSYVHTQQVSQVSDTDL